MVNPIETAIVPNGYTGALSEFLLSRDFLRIPATIDRASARFSAIIKGPCIYGRQTASPGKYAPFFVTSLLTSNAAAGQKDVIVADVSNYKAGDVVIIMDDNAYESNTIASITVATKTLVMTTNLANTYTTAANAKVYLTDGTEKSVDVVIIEESVDFSKTSDVIVSAYQKGSFEETKIYRMTNLTKSECSRLDFRTLQR